MSIEDFGKKLTPEEMVKACRAADDEYTNKLNTIVGIARQAKSSTEEIQWMLLLPMASRALPACLDMLISVAVMREFAKEGFSENIRKSCEINLAIVEGMVKGRTLEETLEAVEQKERGY